MESSPLFQEATLLLSNDKQDIRTCCIGTKGKKNADNTCYETDPVLHCYFVRFFSVNIFWTGIKTTQNTKIFRSHHPNTISQKEYRSVANYLNALLLSRQKVYKNGCIIT